MTCVHCRTEGEGNPCPRCCGLLADLGDDEFLGPAPAKPFRGVASPRRDGPFQPSREDDRELLEMRLRGSLRPLSQFRSQKSPPGWSRNKWGKAIQAIRDPDIPSQ